ncbi:hypothetical protein [Pantoea sp. GM_Pan_4]|uniref:hypothetical protein n=1 Tax=Pantoea sp. GM_Pan_4 TaxID=2937389 RepID=UPI00226A3BF7|nr:hypothetical protein [Pantoea sp. GM_Pan_4]
MSGFTPGRWEVDEDFDVTTEDGTVISWTASWGFDPEEMIANANLTSAAPELLEALQSIVTTDTEVLKILTPEQREAANSAIAKALGQ